MLLTLSNKSVKVLEVLLLQLTLFAVNDSLPLLNDFIFMSSDNISIESDFFILQFVEFDQKLFLCWTVDLPFRPLFSLKLGYRLTDWLIQFLGHFCAFWFRQVRDHIIVVIKIIVFERLILIMDKFIQSLLMLITQFQQLTVYTFV